MGKWRAALALIVVVTGCNYGAPAFSCTDDGQCGAGGKCEVAHGNFCSFPDATCPGGRRFGDLASGQANQCVGEDPPPIDAALDALPDAPPDARTCFGGPFLTVCLQTAPTTPLTISSLMSIDTGNPANCAQVTTSGNYCVIAATTISVESTLRATGTKPLVLLASNSIVIKTNGLIDVASHRATPLEVGAGGSPVICGAGMLPGSANGTNGGGAGGSFTGKGGSGGTGGNGGAGGQSASAVAVTELRGGCPGQQGLGPGVAGGARGQGGGAAYLIAGNSIDVVGTINASGAGGGGGTSGEAGGGGGGSGGMIGFDAIAITATGSIFANGGSGGEGSGTNAPSGSGNPGADPNSVAAALGGTLGSGSGGDGGNGSATAAAGVGGNASNGNGPGGGGGGGGGGAGVVKGPAASLGTLVSPAATP